MQTPLFFTSTMLLLLYASGLRLGPFRIGKQAPKITELKYFDARGAAEVVRVLLALGEIPFLDNRFEIKMVEGKFETPAFTEAKDAGLLSANMMRAPVLVFEGGMVLGQSRAMERYISKQCGWMGKDALTEALIDCVAENVRDIKERYGKVRAIGGMGPNAEKTAATAKFFESGGDYEVWLGKLEKSLPPGRSPGCAVGDSFSYADVCIWHLMKDLFDDKVASAAINVKYSELCKIVAKVEENEKLKKYLAARPNTMF